MFKVNISFNRSPHKTEILLDHILTLQQSLHHYERMLSASHPAYLTQLRVSIAKTEGHIGKAILTISMIAIGILCLQIPIGMLQCSFHVSEFTICFP